MSPESSEDGRHSGPMMIGLFALVIAVVGTAFADSLSDLVDRWSSQPEYSHGFFIPLIAAWHLWNRRAALRQGVGVPARSSVALGVLSVLLLVAGKLTDTFALQHYGLLVAIFGLTLAFGGWSLMKVAFVPLAFLVFMLPLPYLVSAQITLKLQLISSELGVAIIRLFSIPVYLEGNVIDLGAYKLGVVEACSGLRYLIPFLSLGFIGAYLFRAPFWQKAVLFIAVIPITIAMNSFRIAMIGVVSQFYGVSSAESFLHAFEGWAVFLLCIAILYTVMVVFALINRDATPFSPIRFPEAANVPRVSAVVRRRYAPLVVTLGALVIAAVYVHAGAAAVRVNLERAKLIGLPYENKVWSPKIRSISPQVEKVLGADDYIIFDMHPGTKRNVSLYIAYLDYQRDDRSWHSPQQCIPGGGWYIEKLTRTPVDNGAGRTTLVNRVIIKKGRFTQLVYYWYRQRGREIASEWSLKFFLLADAVTRNRTDGALVRLTTPLLGKETLADADNRLKKALIELTPLLPKYIPD